jgi:hypothetical protein
MSRPASPLDGRTKARVRGFTGALFILLGSYIPVTVILTTIQRIAGWPDRLTAMVPGVLLGGAMVVLGSIRVRDAIAAWKPPA